jgi:hypothetical protein
MNANELRIGNYITHNGRINQIGGYIAFYNQYPHPMVNLINNSGQYGIHTIESIPLTEDLILKFGAKKINEYWFEFHTYGIIKHTSFIELYSCVEGDYICNTVKNVHELQNLYYALTGSELVFSTEP